MAKQVPVVIQDDEDTENVVIQVNFQKSTTAVISNFDAWENLALILEGLGATAAQCVEEGRSKKEVYDEIKRYMIQVLGSYEIQDPLSAAPLSKNGKH